jgi:hypothetical protein
MPPPDDVERVTPVAGVERVPLRQALGRILPRTSRADRAARLRQLPPSTVYAVRLR